MLIERSIAFALFLSFVQLGRAQNGKEDSTRWRLGLSLQYGQLTWADQYALGFQYRLGEDPVPPYLVSFYNDHISQNGAGQDGSNALIQGALVLQSRTADQFELQFGWSNYRFQDHDNLPSNPRLVHSAYSAARLEYTRTTSPRERKLKPSFGVRYGIAVFLRTGMSHSDYEYYYSPGRIEEHIKGKGSTALLQPTVWCGYRSPRLLFGVQLHWNVLGYAWGELYTNWYHRRYFDEFFVDRTDSYADWLAVDDFFNHDIFLSDICLKLTLNLVGVGKRQAVPEPRQRKTGRKEAEVQPQGQ